VRDEQACWVLKDGSLSGKAKAVVGDIGDLEEVWDTLDTCSDRLEKYITEAAVGSRQPGGSLLEVGPEVERLIECGSR
jgi:hypothetical protein